ncbi:hypothetical protein L1987_10140 [Smallanthus sonchifolius]|uniref:Uncharacterized protein n=1 Tax=Smallanthus sonchifolius TaxID=185202 RepID=A0ACB9JR90_9ASTR|nr:hypothetical protein L1987_10140 [Smallanthus sonchifolius]
MALEESQEPNQLHFLVIPMGSPGHYIPTIDMAKLVAQHGVRVNIVTTPVNAFRLGSILDQAIQSGMSDFNEKLQVSESEAYGVVVNSFEELEQGYVGEYQKVKGDKVWCIGPLSLCHKDESEKVQRGKKSSINKNECLKWLDSQENSSVIYACLGSVNRIEPARFIELALALESSKRPFIWVVRAGHKTEKIEKWIDEVEFEERTKDRGLLIHGWAPQLLILSHPAIGGFLTHCGWNSTLEGVSAGVPLVTWPQFQQQFYNEKLVVQVLRVGVSVGAQKTVWGDEDKSGEVVKREEFIKAIEMVMEEGKEGEERRKRAKEFGKMANKAIEEGGSSCRNMTRLIEDIRNQSSTRNLS